MKTNSVYDVLICGAGPVGLFLACELALAKCSVLVLEKAEVLSSPLKRIPFGIRGLSAPTIEAFDRRGYLSELEIHKRMKNPHKNGAPADGPLRQVGHFAGIPFLAGHIDSSKWTHRLKSSTEPSLISEMEELETVLGRQAQALGVEVERGVSVTGFDQSRDEVSVQAGERTIRSRWLVGCDGARSIVRKTAGFEFAGTEPEFTGYSTSVEIADSTMLKPGRNVTANGMYMQSQPGYVVIQDFDGGAFHNSGAPISLGHLQDVLRRVSQTDVVINKLNLATTWTDRARQATSYRIGRVLLAGDAAHIHAPLGGQGLNLGIGDAMNLGWKLASVLRNESSEALLDTYQAERRPVGLRVLDWSRAQVEVMKPTPQARALHGILSDLINTRDGATYFAERVWGVSTHYDLDGKNSLVGYSVPNFEFSNSVKIGELMRDGQGLFLEFGSDSLRDFVQDYQNLKYVSGQPSETLGLRAVLVRPDGIVAWASAEGAIDQEELRASTQLWFTKLEFRNP